jgi:hypothetical protein
MAIGLALVFAIPATRTFFALEVPRPTVVLAAVGIIAIAVCALEAGDRAINAVLGRRLATPRMDSG